MEEELTTLIASYVDEHLDLFAEIKRISHAVYVCWVRLFIK